MGVVACEHLIPVSVGALKKQDTPPFYSPAPSQRSSSLIQTASHQHPYNNTNNAPNTNNSQALTWARARRPTTSGLVRPATTRPGTPAASTMAAGRSSATCCQTCATGWRSSSLMDSGAQGEMVDMCGGWMLHVCVVLLYNLQKRGPGMWCVSQLLRVDLNPGSCIILPCRAPPHDQPSHHHQHHHHGVDSVTLSHFLTFLALLLTLSPPTTTQNSQQQV